MDTRNFRPIETEATGVLGGIALLAAGALLWQAVQIGRDARAAGKRQWAVVWTKPGSIEVGNQLKLNGTVVGKAVEIGTPVNRLSIEVSAATEPWRWDATSIDSSESVAIDGSKGRLVMVWPSPDTTQFTGDSGIVTLAHSRVLNRWQISGDTSLLVGTTEWDRLPRCHKKPPPRGDNPKCLSRGGTIRIGDRLIRWLGVQTLARTLVELDRNQIKEAMKPVVTETPRFAADTSDLVGMEVKQTGTFGIGKQGLKLIVPRDHPRLIAQRPTPTFTKPHRRPLSWFLKAKPEPAVELITKEGTDLEGIMAMVNYLSDPAMRDVEPSSRFEDMADGGRMLLEDVRGSIATLQSSLNAFRSVTTEDNGNGMLGRMLVPEPEQRRFREAIDRLPDLIRQVESLTATLETTVDSTGRSVRQLTGRVDSTLITIQPELLRALQGARTLEDSLTTLTKQLETTLASAKKTGKPIGVALLVKLLASTLLDVARLGGVR